MYIQETSINNLENIEFGDIIQGWVGQQPPRNTTAGETRRTLLVVKYNVVHSNTYIVDVEKSEVVAALESLDAIPAYLNRHLYKYRIIKAKDIELHLPKWND